METILNYIDSMFAGVPVTEQTRQLREDITANMSDKYEELIRDGKSRNEAVGAVISDFGNIDEVLEEMGISRTEKAKKAASPVRLFVKRNIAGLIAGAAAPVALMTAFLRMIDIWFNQFSYGIDSATLVLFVISFAAYGINAVILHQKAENSAVSLSADETERLAAHLAKSEKISRILSIAGALFMTILFIILFFCFNIGFNLDVDVIYFAGTTEFAGLIILFMGYKSFMYNYRMLLDIYTGRKPERQSAFQRTVRFCIYWLTIAALYDVHHLMLLDGIDSRWEIFLYHFPPVNMLLCLAAISVSYVIDAFLKYKKAR